jgi:hypothetical protein
MTSNINAILITLVLILSGTKAMAWGDVGHQTVGEIAEQILANDNVTKSAIRNILGVEPLAMAATWPDHIRSDGRFDDFAPYHYVTIYKDAKKHTEKDAWTILNKYPGVLTSNVFNRESKIIALRYLIHVVGDIQQPLHAGHEYDRGGNDCIVEWKTNKFITNLHSVWDTHLVEAVTAKYQKLEPDVKYYGYKQLARALMLKHKDIVTTPENLNIPSWVKQAEELRKTVVYPDKLDDANRPYCQRNRNDVNPKDIPVINEKYISGVSEIIEKQLVRGGVRLAALLKETLRVNKGHAPTEAEILEILKLHND